MACDLGLLPEAIRPRATELANHIDFESMNDKGAGGHVLIGFHKLLERDVVVKFYYWGGGDHAEPALLARFESDFILKVHHAESINANDAFFITPYCANGDLDDALVSRKFGPLQSVDVLAQIAAGVSFLHGRGYLHRDLKPANIFCRPDGSFVIGDFGSVLVQNTDGYSISITQHSLLYRPPEEIDEKNYYRQGDIYQLGIVLYQLLGGHLPYVERDWLSTKQQVIYDALKGWDQRGFVDPIIKGKIRAGHILDMNKLPPWTPPALKTLIRGCTYVAREKRIATVADLTGRINNVRSKLPDWRIDEYPILHRAKKQFRIVKGRQSFLIEKSVGGPWRTERAHNPATLDEAVRIAESL